MCPVIYISTYLKKDPSLGKNAFPILHNILIENNRFCEFPGTAAFVGSARRVIFRNNFINNTIRNRNELPYRGSLGAAYAPDLFVTGNQWDESPLQKTPGIFIEKNTAKDIFVWDNRIIDKASK